MTRSALLGRPDTAPGWVRRLRIAIIAAAVLCSSMVLADAAPASAAINPAAGCTTNVFPPNDDSSLVIPLDFSINAGGTTTNVLVLSNNGYVRAGSSYWWVMQYDIDTRNSSPVTYGNITVDGHNAFCVNWVDVGYFPAMNDKLSDGQLIIVDRSDRAPGDIDTIVNLGEVLFDGYGIAVGYQDPVTGYGAPGSGFSGAYNPGGPYEGLTVSYTHEDGVLTSTTTNYDQAAATVALDGLAATYDGTPKVVTATVDPEEAGAATITYDGSTAAPTAAGTYAVVATVDTADYYGTATGSLVIAKADQALSITDVSGAAFGDAPVTIAASSDAGLPVTVTAAGTCALTDDQLAFTAAGTCTLTLYQAGDANHNETTTDVVVEVAKGAAALNVSGLSQTYDGTPRALAVSTAPADLDGVVVTYDGSATPPVDAGTYAVAVTLTNDNWAAAPINATMIVGQADQTITVTAPDAATYLDGPVTYTATSDSGLAVTSTSTGPCTLNGDQLSIDGAGICTVTSDQPGDANHQAAASVVHVLTIAKAAQTVTISGDTSLSYLGAPGSVTTSSSANLAVSVAVSGPCSYDAGVLTANGPGTCTLTATQAGDADYESAAPATLTVTVAQAGQSVTVDLPDTVVYNSGPVPLVGSASSGLPVTWAAAGACEIADGSIRIVDVGTCTVTATQSGDANYAAATPVTTTIEVTPAPVKITLKNLTQTEGAVSGVTVVTDPPGLPITVTVTYYKMLSQQADGTGSTVVPTEPGEYLVVASVDDPRWDVEDVTGTFTVLAAEAAPTPGPSGGPTSGPTPGVAGSGDSGSTPSGQAGPALLPQTGSDLAVLAGFGLVLLAAGMVVSRRRRRDSAG